MHWVALQMFRLPTLACLDQGLFFIGGESISYNAPLNAAIQSEWLARLLQVHLQPFICSANNISISPGSFANLWCIAAHVLVIHWQARTFTPRPDVAEHVPVLQGKVNLPSPDDIETEVAVSRKWREAFMPLTNQRAGLMSFLQRSTSWSAGDCFCITACNGTKFELLHFYLLHTNVKWCSAACSNIK